MTKSLETDQDGTASGQSPPDLAGIETWIFDLDNTLYPASCNLFDQVDRRMGLFIENLLGLDRVQARALQKDYFRNHGTTLRGLMDLHGVDPHSYLDFVHEIDVSVVPENPSLDLALGRLPGRKVIFTNASGKHVDKVLAQLGIGAHFDGVFDIIAAEFLPKPDPATYRGLVEGHDIDPASAVFFEDTARNLKPAADMGMTTVWVETYSNGSHLGADGDYIHHRIDDLTAWLSDLSL